MSSINPHFTFEYSQPEEYRFSHDSVFMARRVFEILEGVSLNDWHILDLCAGCGIIGLDFLFHLRTAGVALPLQTDFLDVQESYAEHFERNRRAIPEARTRFINQNYENLLGSAADPYDLILCNPPFFREGQGSLSPSEFKNRCRFFIDSDFPTLLNSIVHAMKPGTGRAYLLLRDLNDHGINVERETRDFLKGKSEIQTVGDIRGTALVSLSF